MIALSEFASLSAESPKRTRCLLLASDDRGQGQFSGYTRLAKYLTDVTLIDASRAEPRHLLERSAVWAVDRIAASRWYRTGSLKVEARAWWRIQNELFGLVHFMWGDRDWGFLDWLPTRSRPALCATFHSCHDTLPKVIRRPGALKKFSAIILMSEVQRPFFEASGVPPDRLHVVHHGIDCEYFRPQIPSGSGDKFNVLSVGNYRRNFELLHQVSILLKPYRDIRITIIAHPRAAAIFEGAENVMMLSGLTDDELRSVYRRASCLIAALDNATANNAILEAMACGLPIVSENVGGVAEYTGPDAALLCTPRSAQALTDSILAIYRSPETSARMSWFARERAKEFDWPIVAQKTAGIYQAILAANR